MDFTKAIVLSRFNENIGWISEYENTDINIFVYDKGSIKPTVKFENIKFIKRSNLGRECDTFLYHIIENYDNLSDLTIFTQAWPFDNIPLFSDYLNGDLNLENCNNYFNWYGEMYQICDQDGYPGIYPISSGHPNPFNKTFKIIYEDVFGKPCPREIKFKPNSSFCVSKDLILKNKKEFYEKLLNFLRYEEQNDFEGIFKFNPYEGHIIERMWGFIFNEI
jgi:hypothetical protein